LALAQADRSYLVELTIMRNYRWVPVLSSRAPASSTHPQHCPGSPLYTALLSGVQATSVTWCRHAQPGALTVHPGIDADRDGGPRRAGQTTGRPIPAGCERPAAHNRAQHMAPVQSPPDSLASTTSTNARPGRPPQPLCFPSVDDVNDVKLRVKPRAGRRSLSPAAAPLASSHACQRQQWSVLACRLHPGGT